MTLTVKNTVMCKCFRLGMGAILEIKKALQIRKEGMLAVEFFNKQSAKLSQYLVGPPLEMRQFFQVLQTGFGG